MKRFLNVSLTRTINPDFNRDEKVSKCIFDIRLKQLVFIIHDSCPRCDLLSKCIFDIRLKQPKICCELSPQSCDLLSKCIFDIRLKQLLELLLRHGIVVICFLNVSLTFVLNNFLFFCRYFRSVVICFLNVSLTFVLNNFPNQSN